jgi:hypothetical protein
MSALGPNQLGELGVANDAPDRRTARRTACCTLHPLRVALAAEVVRAAQGGENNTKHACALVSSWVDMRLGRGAHQPPPTAGSFMGEQQMPHSKVFWGGAALSTAGAATTG